MASSFQIQKPPNGQISKIDVKISS